MSLDRHIDLRKLATLVGDDKAEVLTWTDHNWNFCIQATWTKNGDRYSFKKEMNTRDLIGVRDCCPLLEIETGIFDIFYQALKLQLELLRAEESSQK